MKKQVILCDICGREIERTFMLINANVDDKKNVTGVIDDICSPCAKSIMAHVQSLRPKKETALEHGTRVHEEMQERIKNPPHNLKIDDDL